MSDNNESQIKIYLYLLRNLSKGASVSVITIAFNCSSIRLSLGCEQPIKKNIATITSTYFFIFQSIYLCAFTVTPFSVYVGHGKAGKSSGCDRAL